MLVIETCNILSVYLQICLGTVSNIEEAVRWLSYTYMHVRMRYNPLVYGITYKTLSVSNSIF